MEAEAEKQGATLLALNFKESENTSASGLEEGKAVTHFLNPCEGIQPRPHIGIKSMRLISYL